MMYGNAGFSRVKVRKDYAVEAQSGHSVGTRTCRFFFETLKRSVGSNPTFYLRKGFVCSFLG